MFSKNLIKHNHCSDFRKNCEDNTGRLELIYLTPNVFKIIEYCGRICYNSTHLITDDSYKDFIKNIVISGHESVIEHSNMVFVLEKKDIDINNVRKYLFDVKCINGLIEISEHPFAFILSGNIRMFKDIIRNSYLKHIIMGYGFTEDSYNPYIEDILNTFKYLPKYLYEDFIKEGYMINFLKRENKENQRFETSKKLDFYAHNCVEHKLNDYVTILNKDNFNIITQYPCYDYDKLVFDKNFNTNYSKKHNRITYVINVPRDTSHQEVRHRLVSYSQKSQRYVDEQMFEYNIPDSIDPNKDYLISITPRDSSYPPLNYDLSYHDLMELINQFYKALREDGVKKEDARAVLPNTTMSTIAVTKTLYQLDNYLKVRTGNSAQKFIRENIAKPIKQYVDSFNE